jgi:hypothetical protein
MRKLFATLTSLELFVQSDLRTGGDFLASTAAHSITPTPIVIITRIITHASIS